MDNSPKVLFWDTLVVCSLVTEPLLVKLTTLINGSPIQKLLPTKRIVFKPTFGQRWSLTGEISRFVLSQEHVQVGLQLLPIAAGSMTEPDEGRVDTGGRVVAVVIVEPKSSCRSEPKTRVPSFLDLKMCTINNNRNRQLKYCLLSIHVPLIMSDLINCQLIHHVSCIKTQLIDN